MKVALLLFVSALMLTACKPKESVKVSEKDFDTLYVKTITTNYADSIKGTVKSIDSVVSIVNSEIFIINPMQRLSDSIVFGANREYRDKAIEKSSVADRSGKTIEFRNSTDFFDFMTKHGYSKIEYNPDYNGHETRFEKNPLSRFP